MKLIGSLRSTNINENINTNVKFPFKTRISRFSGFAVCGWNGSMDDWVRIPAEPWGFAKMCYSSKWPQRMYFRLPIWLTSLSFWFWGDRETSSGDGNYPQFCTFFAHLKLNNVHAYIAWSWKTTLITWFFNGDDIQLQIQVPPPRNFDRKWGLKDRPFTKNGGWKNWFLGKNRCL